MWQLYGNRGIIGSEKVSGSKRRDGMREKQDYAREEQDHGPQGEQVDIVREKKEYDPNAFYDGGEERVDGRRSQEVQCERDADRIINCSECLVSDDKTNKQSLQERKCLQEIEVLQLHVFSYRMIYKKKRGFLFLDEFFF